MWFTQSKAMAYSIKQKMVFWNFLFSMIQWMLGIWSLVPLPFLKPAWTSGSSRFTYCWSLAWRSFEHYFASVWDECNCTVVWAFFGNAGDTGSIPGSGRSPGDGIDYPLQYSLASLVAQLATKLPAMQETWVQSLGLEDPLEKRKATHSSILAWRIPRTTVHGVPKSWTDWVTFMSIHLTLGSTDPLYCLPFH